MVWKKSGWQVASSHSLSPSLSHATELREEAQVASKSWCGHKSTRVSSPRREREKRAEACTSWRGNYPHRDREAAEAAALGGVWSIQGTGKKQKHYRKREMQGERETEREREREREREPVQPGILFTYHTTNIISLILFLHPCCLRFPSSSHPPLLHAQWGKKDWNIGKRYLNKLARWNADGKQSESAHSGPRKGKKASDFAVWNEKEKKKDNNNNNNNK